MRKMNHFALTLIVTALVLIGCDSKKYKALDSGLEYKYVEEGNGPAPQDGEFLTLHMKYVLEETDSVLFSSLEQPTPVVLKYADSAWKTQEGTIWEGLHMLKQGDSVSFRIMAENLYQKSFGQPVPANIKKEQMIKFFIGVDSVMDETQYRAFEEELFKKEMERLNAQSEEQLSADVKKIETYLSENNIEAKSTDSGLYYVIHKEGKGENAQPGDKVSVHYTGTTMEGKKFDSSLDRGEPIEFTLGQGQVIKGWDEGITLLNKGGKATLYIPSPMAYGPRGAGGVIKPNEILIFDVELVDIKN